MRAPWNRLLNKFVRSKIRKRAPKRRKELQLRGVESLEDRQLLSAAPVLHWDPDGNAANGYGGDGPWDTTNEYWYNATTEDHESWVPGAVAVFEGAAGTVTIAESTTVAPAAIRIDNAGYTIAAGTGGELSLSAAVCIDVKIGDVEISAPVTGSGSLLKAGDGRLTLSGNNDYTGGNDIEGGTLAAGSETALGGSDSGLWGPLSMSMNATLDLNGHNVEIGDLSGNGGFITVTAGAEYEYMLTVHQTGNTTFLGTLCDVWGPYLRFDLSGGGYLTYGKDYDPSIDCWSVLDAPVEIHGEGTTLDIRSAAVVQAWGWFNVYEDATVDNHGWVFTDSQAFIYDGGTLNNYGMFSSQDDCPIVVGRDPSYNLDGTGTLNNYGSILVPIDNYAETNFSHSASAGHSAALSGDGTFHKTGRGTLTLTGADSYAGTIEIDEGVLAFGTNSGDVPEDSTIVINAGGVLKATGPSGYTTAQGWIDSGKVATSSSGTLALTSSESSVSLASNGRSYSSLYLGSIGAYTLSGAITPAGDTYRFGGGGGTLTLGSSAVLTNGENPRSLEIGGGGGGWVALTNANSYTGGTTISAGTLRFSAQNETTKNLGTGNVSFQGGTLQWADGNDDDVSGYIAPIPSGQSAILDTNGNDVTFSSGLSGDGGVEERGAGSLTLNGNCTFTGALVVSGGSLEINGAIAANVYGNGGTFDNTGSNTPQWWKVTLDSGAIDADALDEFPDALTVGTDGLYVRNTWVLAVDWKKAVEDAIAGGLEVVDTALPPTYSNTSFFLGPFDIGLASEFTLDDAPNALDPDQKVIVLDDPWEYDTTSGVDFYYKVTAVTDSGGGPPPAPTCPTCGGLGIEGSQGGVRYFNGEIRLFGDDLGPGSGAQRSYDNTFAGQGSNGNGYGWQQTEQPRVVQASDALVVMFDTRDAVWFTADGTGTFAPRYGVKGSLTHDDATHLFTMTRPGGTVYRFYDFAQSDAPKGALKEVVQPSGHTLSATYDAHGYLDKLQERVSATAAVYQERDYTYTAGLLDSIVLKGLVDGDLALQRKVDYVYYAAGDAYGLPGDLKTATTRDYLGNDTWTDFEDSSTSYYRYYTTNDENGPGFRHGLKREIPPAEFSRLHTDTGGDLSKAVEGTPGMGEVAIADYTDHYFEYGAEHRVTKEIVRGGSGDYDFTYAENSATDDYNYWKMKTVETRANRDTNTVYTNYAGEVILTDLKDDATGAQTLSYHRYDDDGREILSVSSSAFVLSGGKYYDDYTYNDLVNYAGGDSPFLNNSAGLFEVTKYYTSTTADEDTPGGVEGYVYQTAVAHGETQARSASPIKQSQYTYYKHTVGDVSIYPTAEASTYSNENGTGEAKTSYSYGWYTTPGMELQAQEIVTTLPVVSSGQNGSGVAATSKQWFDAQGQLAWTLDQRGSLTYSEYDLVTGRLAWTLQDAGWPTISDLGLDPPSGWGGSGGLSLITDYQYDGLGRVVETLGPAHTVDLDGTATLVRTAAWTTYRDADRETWTAQGYIAYGPYTHQWDESAVLGPISITKTDAGGRATDQLQAVWDGTVADFLAGDDNELGARTAWSSSQYDQITGRLASTRVYYDIPSSGEGTSTGNYNQTDYGYDANGRSNYTKTPDGTITRTVHDARGNALETWIGTDDTGATDADPGNGGAGGNNMVMVSESTYDADGNVTATTSWANEEDSYTTYYEYDWRDRPMGTLGPDGVATIQTFDNLGRSTQTDTYANATYSSGHINTTSGNLRGRSTAAYDALGQVYESRTYEVAPASDAYPGTVGNYLPSYSWYDAAGNVIKSQTGTTGAFEKFLYDSLGRQSVQYAGYDTSETTSELLGAGQGTLGLNDDRVLQQTQTWYDAAGNPVGSATYQQFADGTPVTGALTGANSYATAAATWYDGVGRGVATAYFGREDSHAGGITRNFFNSNGTLKDASPADGVPDVAQAARAANHIQTTVEDAGSQAGIDFQLSLVQYNAAGRAYRSIDNLGRINQTEFDLAGRTTGTIQNYVDGTPGAADTAQDVTTAYVYDPQGRLSAQVAFNADGTTITAQQTTYLYESLLDGSWQTNAIYPDSADLPLAPKTITALSFAGGTATATVTGRGRSFLVGQWVVVSGATNPEYNGWFQVTGNATDSFTYAVSGTPGNETGAFPVQAIPLAGHQVVTALDRSGSVATATVTGHGYDFAVGQWVRLSGATNPEYNGWFQVTGNTANTFTYAVSGTPGNESGTFHVQTITPMNYQAVTALSSPGSGVAKAYAAYNYAINDLVSITGADQSQYNGTFSVTAVGSDGGGNYFNYAITGNPPTATGDIRVHLVGQDQVKTSYDWLGRTETATDQRGVKHTFHYDSAGRLGHDRVTSFGSGGVDQAIKTIERGYDDLSRVELVTSYDTADLVVNEVGYVYNGWGQVHQEYQEHQGTVDGNTPYVEYDYEDGAVSGVAKYLRLDSVTYPNGRVVDYLYGSTGSMDDILGRVAAIDDSTSTGSLASYSYLGLGTIVREDYEQPDVRLDYNPAGSSNTYTGFDRFGRVVDQLWRDYNGTPDDFDRFSYGYDRAGNRVWRQNEVAHARATYNNFDELYTYDAVNQLQTARRGKLNTNHDGFDSGEQFAQNWTLDALGNWGEFKSGSAQGTWSLDQDRQHNAVNETGAITGSGGANWSDPTHDAAGNMTSVPKGTGPANAYGLKWDAWNRLVEVKDGATVVATFLYDGTNRRILKGFDTRLSPLGVDTYEHYYLSGQQVVETRQASSPSTDPSALDPHYQYVYSQRYIDAPVLRDTYDGATLQSGLRLYYLGDANFNVTTVLYDNSGWQPEERYVYSPYGTTTCYDPTWAYSSSGSGMANTLLFTGRERDETGLYYYRARYYDTELGRFVGRDPMGYAADANSYRYCADAPVDFVDPSGLNRIDSITIYTKSLRQVRQWVGWFYNGTSTWNVYMPVSVSLYGKVEAGANGEVTLEASGGLNIFGNGATLKKSVTFSASLAVGAEVKMGFSWDVLQYAYREDQYVIRKYAAAARICGDGPPYGQGLVEEVIQNAASGIFEMDAGQQTKIDPLQSTTVWTLARGQGTVSNVHLVPGSVEATLDGYSSLYVFYFFSVDQEPIDHRDSLANVFAVAGTGQGIEHKLHAKYFTSGGAGLLEVGRQAVAAMNSFVGR